MSNHPLTFTLESNSITVSPDSFEVKEGDSVTITVNRPGNGAVYCAMLFDHSSTDQDPFNALTGGTTYFNLANGVDSTTINISNSAAFQSDSYTVVLSGSEIFVKDPTIIVKE